MTLKPVLLLMIPVGIIAVAAYGYWQGTPDDVVFAVRNRNIAAVKTALARDPQAVHTKVYPQAYERASARQEFVSRFGRSPWEGRYVIHDAITQWIDPLPMIELLAAAGADLSVRLNGRTLLHVAAHDGSVEAITWLLDHGANVNATNTCDDGCPELGQTPLFDLQNFHDEVTPMLLEHGADPLVRSANGQTALHVAAVVGTIGGAFQLCRYGTDPTIKDGQGRTAQDLALAADRAGRDTERRTLFYGPGEQADWLKPGGGCEMLARRVATTGAPVGESDATEVFSAYACARDTRHCSARK